ncbi:MAG: hypothetical protein HFG73_06415 [Hungatella sp.]|nr:hypothetical protein [Hungatella sp.]
MRRVVRLAMQTFLALKDPYGSVEKVYPQAIRAAERFEKVRYLGVKHAAPIPAGLLRTLRKMGYELHTLDRCSVNGRAVDMMIKNPLTGRPMTGSSSGTAVNVFLGINDLGIGTDGGGSVLAPAMSLQCYGFISPLLEREHMKKYEKKSTDGLCFTPSLGFIARDLEILKEAAEAGLGISLKGDGFHDGQEVLVLCPEGLREKIGSYFGGETERKTETIRLETGVFPPPGNAREPLIAFLREQLPVWDVVIHHEKRIDVDGLGDSILGHFDGETQADQAKSGKHFIRVANMAGATALCIPDGGLASGYVLMCRSKPENIRRLFEIARRFPAADDELLERYFRNLDAYFPMGVLEAGLYDG